MTQDPRAQRRLWYVIGGVLVAAFLVYGATSFRSNLTPYVSFDEAMRTSARVQVAGKLAPDSTEYVDEAQSIRFGLLDDDGQVMAVEYAGPKPGNFEEATQIVAIGNYENGVFDAEQLLVKCPSKYQGVDEDVESHA